MLYKLRRKVRAHSAVRCVRCVRLSGTSTRVLSGSLLVVVAAAVADVAAPTAVASATDAAAAYLLVGAKLCGLQQNAAHET